MATGPLVTHLHFMLWTTKLVCRYIIRYQTWERQKATDTRKKDKRAVKVMRQVLCTATNQSAPPN